MYTNILIPTDGSELAGKAVQHGIALAKRIGAKVTALTVLLPFHVFTTDTQMIEDTPAQYRVRMQEHAEKTLSAVGQAAQAAGVACERAMSSMSIPTEQSLILQPRRAVT
jgi:nucleotide-binding universal stress UspA family protein